MNPDRPAAAISSPKVEPAVNPALPFFTFAFFAPAVPPPPPPLGVEAAELGLLLGAANMVLLATPSLAL
jgi:hypothetical protein